MRRGLALGLLMVLSAAAARKPHELSPLAVDMLAAHNAYRKQLRLRPLAWSDKLATAAQSWADTLLKQQQFAHQSQSRYGENLFEIRGGSAAPGDVVHDWASESLDYDYASGRCHSVCGHYTQIVWRSTVDMGCAVARGGVREVWVCRYSPPGNVAGERPY
jgi:pathogenesis-related protein 1